MSKSTNRRLAVVAGAALALGSMAPALAARVQVNGDSSATVDASADVAAPTVPNLLPENFVAGLTDDVKFTADTAKAALFANAYQITGHVEAMIAAIRAADPDVDLDVDLTASGNAGGNVSGNVSGDVSGDVNLPIGVVVDGAGILVGDAHDAVDDVNDIASHLRHEARQTVGKLKYHLFGTATDLLDGGLTGILDGSVSGNVNVIASVMGNL